MSTIIAKLNSRASDMKLRRNRRRSGKSLSDDASVCSATSLGSSLTSLSDSFHSSSTGAKTVSFRRRMNVTFEIDYMVQDIDDVEDFFYTSDDFSDFKARDKQLLASDEDLDDDSDDCRRGLEREEPVNKRRISSHKKECYAIVLKSANKPAEEIAQAYSRATRSAVRDASIIARLDAMAAKEYASQ
ncbi:MAG: hypothetical protein SGILL_009898 [Bacillariaceae sp.]